MPYHLCERKCTLVMVLLPDILGEEIGPWWLGENFDHDK